MFSSENYSLGEYYFKENEPEQAIPYLRLAMTEESVDKMVYNYSHSLTGYPLTIVNILWII